MIYAGYYFVISVLGKYASEFLLVISILGLVKLERGREIPYCQMDAAGALRLFLMEL